MKTRRFLSVVMFLFASAAPGWADDHATSVASLKTRAAQGEAEAQVKLGALYVKGQDDTEALKWFRLAAAQGDAQAQFNLGFMYSKGRGVPQDYVQAYQWYNLAAGTFAASPNHDHAIKARDAVAARMTPAQLTEVLKIARE